MKKVIFIIGIIILIPIYCWATRLDGFNNNSSLNTGDEFVLWDVNNSAVRNINWDDFGDVLNTSVSSIVSADTSVVVADSGSGTITGTIDGVSSFVFQDQAGAFDDEWVFGDTNQISPGLVVQGDNNPYIEVIRTNSTSISGYIVFSDLNSQDWAIRSNNAILQFDSSNTLPSTGGTTRMQLSTSLLTLGTGYSLGIGDTSPDANLDVVGDVLFEPQTVTVADSGDANPATSTLTPTGSNVQITCNDTDSCDITMGETGIGDGQIVSIVNVSANSVDFSDTSGVSELTGAIALGQYDTLEMVYVVDRWVQTSTSNN